MDTKLGLTEGEKEAAAEEVVENIKKRREARQREDEAFDIWDNEYQEWEQAEAEKDRIEKANEIIEKSETYAEAYEALMDAGYENFDADVILQDFFEIKG